MYVSEIIEICFGLLGREDLADELKTAVETDGALGQETKTMLHCYNAVEDELSRYFFPLEGTVKLIRSNGKFSFLAIPYTMLKVLRVESEGKPLSFTVFPQYLTVEEDVREVWVSFRYAPKARTIYEESTYSQGTVSPYLLAYGVLAEYCALSGDMQYAQSWEVRYRKAIADVLKINAAHIPYRLRRWI